MKTLRMLLLVMITLAVTLPLSVAADEASDADQHVLIPGGEDEIDGVLLPGGEEELDKWLGQSKVVTPGGTPPVDAPPELREAEYFHIGSGRWQFPAGWLEFDNAVVGILFTETDYLSAVIVGEFSATLELPGTADSLNLFRELELGGAEVLLANLNAAYLGAGEPFFSDFALSMPDVLPLEFTAFNYETKQALVDCYMQSYSDAWRMGGAPGHPGGGGGHPGMGGPPASRPPTGPEFYAALFTTDGTRWDVDSTERGLTVTDYYKNIDYYVQPWEPEEGALDPRVDFLRISYEYAVGDVAAGEITVGVEAYFTVSEPVAELALVSYPWLEFTSITNELTAELDATRGGTGVSDWMLFVRGDWQPGTEYRLRLSGCGNPPDDYRGIDAGGVYRLDTAALWPGEGQPVDITISAAMEGHGWQAVASEGADVQFYAMGGPEGGYGPERDEASASWPGSRRNQMLVLSRQQTTELDSATATIRIHAPATLIDSAPGMQSISALTHMLSFYSGLWGARATDELDVFIIPEDLGVQAFVDGGFVFLPLADRPGIPLIAHETAHLWWGQDVASPRWFYEGMANYGAAKFIEYYYGDNGPAAGQDDPYSYRSHLIKFALGHELPLPIERRDELDDMAALYQVNAAILLSLDDIAGDGIDDTLALIHAEHTGGPALSTDELAEIFAREEGAEVAWEWNRYVELGTYPEFNGEDPSFRRLEFTAERRDYVDMLGWLIPARRKQMLGDPAGALYCMEQVLNYRQEPKDYLLLNELRIAAGRIDIAHESCLAMLENPAFSAEDRLEINWQLAQVYRELGQAENERTVLQFIIDHGAEHDQLRLVSQATARLAELNLAAIDERQAGG